MATRVGLSYAWLSPLSQPPPPQTPTGCKFLVISLIQAAFCVKISQFSLPWQQGLVWAKFNLHRFIGWPR